MLIKESIPGPELSEKKTLFMPQIEKGQLSDELIFASTNQNLKRVSVEALMGFSTDGLKNTFVSQGFVPEVAPSVGTVV